MDLSVFTLFIVLRCNVSFSGTTCAINECSGFCFNNGTCQVGKDSYSCKFVEQK